VARFNNCKEDRCAEETFEKFKALLMHEPDRVAYGEKYIMEAQGQSAIKDLFISDCFITTKDFEKRRKYNKLLEDVKHGGGEVHLTSKGNPLSTKLNDFTGMSAILYYPLNIDYLDETGGDSKIEAVNTPTIKVK